MLKKYKEHAHAETIMDEYMYLCGRSFSGTSAYHIPHIGEIFKETWETTNLGMVERFIQESVYRRDYEIYGLSKQDFLREAYQGGIPGLELPELKARDIQLAVYVYLRDHYVCFTDYEDMVVNSPFGSGVW